jgi:enoyl-CoA hydratase/carnithine racemase
VSTTDVTVEQAGAHVGIVRLNRPPNNYFDTALIAAVADAYEGLDGSGWCRAIVLASEGRHFCAGLDFAGNASRDIAALYGAALRLFAAPLPVVAACRVPPSAVAAGSRCRPTSVWPRRRAGSAPTFPAWASTRASR